MQTILIVDHVASQRELLRAWLKDDYIVYTAADAATGMALAAQTEPDLIFLALPDRDGGEVACRLKTQARLRDTLLIALTAPALPGEGPRAWAAGWADTIYTPLDEDQVAATLRKWLGGG